MICKITGTGKGYSHSEVQTWEITGPTLSGAEEQELVFPASWSATGNGSASRQDPDSQWNASWTVEASQPVRLFIQPLTGPDRWRFGHASGQAHQSNGVTGSQTLKSGSQSKTSPISETAFEAILGATQYLPRDSTGVVAGRATSTQAVGNMGLGVPAGAALTAEWTWKFTATAPGAKVTLRVADGAVQPNVKVPKAWAAVRDASRSVIVEATTSPENSPAEWMHIQWSGPGEPVAGAPNRRRLSRLAAGKLTVAASLESSRDEIDVWILWSSVEIRTSGSRPANAAPFPPGQDGTDKLGAVKYLLSSFSPIDPKADEFVQDMGAAGKVCAVVTVLPQGASDVVISGWAIRRELQCHTWSTGRKVTNSKKAWTDEWVDDTSVAELLRLTPDAEGRIYDIDAPNIAIGERTFETYTNFRQVVTWNAEKCSDFTPWHWNCRWKLNRNPGKQIEQADVGPGNLALPSKPHYPKA
jgi:hypothetical protein